MLEAHLVLVSQRRLALQKGSCRRGDNQGKRVKIPH